VTISRLSDEEITQKEKEWDTRTKDKVLEMFLQYSEFNYPNKGVKNRGEMDARTLLDGEKIPDKGVTDMIPAKVKVIEKPTFKDKYLKISLIVGAAILVAFFVLKR